jgi:hypothetical protein
MKTGRKSRPWGLIFTALLVLAVLAAWTATALAQDPDQNYDLSWFTVDGGGYTWSTGGSYSLGSTTGQYDAGLHEGGSYTLGGGFWEGGALAQMLNRIYLPLIMRTYTAQ